MAFIKHLEVKTREYEPGLFGIKLIDGARGSQHISLLRGWMKPGAQHAPHTHEVEEAIVFLSGRGIQKIGADTFDVGPGDSILVPPGIVHSTFNNGEEDLVFVAAYPDSVISGQPAPEDSSRLELREPVLRKFRNVLAWALRQASQRLTAPVQPPSRN